MAIKQPQKPKIIVITGPTASGKSALATHLARALGGEVVSADSRQVYRGLNLGTGKVTKKEMAGVPHHLLDIADPKRAYSAARYTKDARRVIEDIVRRKKVPIVCGGTGFYIDTLLGRVTLPDVPPNPTLRATLAKKTTPQLLAHLKKLDPKRAEAIDPFNRVRIVRAIEVAKALGKVPTVAEEELYKTLVIGLTVPKEVLHKKIGIRLLARIKAGMIAEAKRLRRKGLSYKRMEELGLEYRYMARHLQGKISKEEMVHQLAKEIEHYAKRQMTWFKRDKQTHWVSPTDFIKAKLLCRNFLENNS